MRRSRIAPIALSPLLFGLLLTACAAPPAPPRLLTEIHRVPQTVPVALLSCAAAPEPPGQGMSPADVAGFILDLAAAGADCRARLAQVRDLLGRTAP